MQAAMAEQNEAEEVSGEEYSGDWGERHDDELEESTEEAEQQVEIILTPELAAASETASAEAEGVLPEEAALYTDVQADETGYPVE
jgi:hypothetical protein